MGFFSKTCAKTNLPVMAGSSWPDAKCCEVVVLFPNGDKLSGVYDGYGRIDGASIAHRFDEAKFVLKSFYAGESYEQLGDSHDEPGQGHFHSSKFVSQAYAKGGYPSFEAYLKDYKEWEDEDQQCRMATITVTVDGLKRSYTLQAIEKPDMVSCGGEWLPGWEIINPAVMYGFERSRGEHFGSTAEVIAYAMNEGGVMEDTINLSDDKETVVRWKAAIVEQVAQEAS